MDAVTKKVTNLDQRKVEPFQDPGVAAQVIKRALDGFDQKDKAISNAIKVFMSAHEKVAKEEEKREIVKMIESEEALDAVVRLRRAEIELRAAEFRLKLVQKKFGLALEDLKLKLEEFEAIEEEEYDWNIDKLLILRKNKEREEAAFQRIFEFAKSMADGTSEVPLQSIRKGNLPDHLNQAINEIRTNMKEFFKDLADFLLETKIEGQRKVMQICTDPDMAKEVAYDDDDHNHPEICRQGRLGEGSHERIEWASEILGRISPSSRREIRRKAPSQ